MAPHVHHGIDGGGTANHLAPRQFNFPVIAFGFGFTGVVPVDAGIFIGMVDPGRNVDHQFVIHWPGFKNQHLILGAFSQAVGKHAACRTRANNDVIVFGQNAFPKDPSLNSKRILIRYGICTVVKEITFCVGIFPCWV